MTLAYTQPPGGDGQLFHNASQGTSGCPDCGWHGATPFIDGALSHLCPACETGTADFSGDLTALADAPPGALYRPGAVVVPIRREPKVGRNEPCPCGSGAKHKRCCLRKEAA